MIYTDFLGEKVSTLGMGNMRLPTVDGNPTGKIDYKKAQKMIDYCISSGVNYFDTAYVYHGGDSEMFLGSALEKYDRKQYKLATKFLWTADFDFKRVFQVQLRKLQTSYIDYYLIHSVEDDNADSYLEKMDYEYIHNIEDDDNRPYSPEEDICENSIEYFLRQKKEGRIKHLGFSFHGSLSLLEKFLKHHKWDFVQIQFNYLDYYFGQAKAQYDILKKYDMPLVIMEPVRGGALARLNEGLLEKIKKERPLWSPASLALRFVRQFKQAKVILSGMSDMNQIQDNINTFSDDTPFSKQDNDLAKEIATEYKNTITVPCTACRYCCDTCPSKLDIPSLFALYNEYGYSLEFSKPDILKKMHKLPKQKQASSCVSCGNCKRHCPQHIDIPAIMKKIVALG